MNQKIGNALMLNKLQEALGKMQIVTKDQKERVMDLKAENDLIREGLKKWAEACEGSPNCGCYPHSILKSADDYRAERTRLREAEATEPQPLSPLIANTAADTSAKVRALREV